MNDQQAKPIAAPAAWKTAAWVAGCCIVLSIGGYLRLHRIAEQGLAEGDTVSYYNIAKQWSHGDTSNFYGDAFYRPVVYALNGLAIHLLGDNDSSILTLNAAVDLVSLVLILFVSRRLSGSRLPGIAAALVYAVSPYVTHWCRTGMPHTLSAFFVLLALVLFVLGPRTRFSARRLLFDAAAGISLGLAANTHADLALLGPGFVACQCVQTLARRREGRPRVELFARAAVLTAGFAMPYAFGLALFGAAKVFDVISHEFNASTFTPSYIRPAPLYRAPFDLLTISSRLVFGHALWIPALVALPPAAWGFRRMLAKTGKTGQGTYSYVPWVLVLSYVVIFPVTIGTFDESYVRVLIPLLPLLLLGACCAALELARAAPRPVRTASLAMLVALSLWTAFREMGEPHYFQDKTWFVTSRYRAVYNLLGSRVTAERRLLIVPSTAYRAGGFQTDLYFGPNAEFLLDLPRSEAYTSKWLARIARDDSFSYVYYLNFVDLRINDETPLAGVEGRSWQRGAGDAPYSFEREALVLADFTLLYHAHLLADAEWGKVFSLRKRRIFPNSDFALGTLEGWHAEGAALAFTVLPIREGTAALSVFAMEPPISPGARNAGPDARPGVNSTFHVDTRSENATTGELVGDSFKIEEGIIGFQIAGSVDPENIHVALRVSNTEFRAGPAGDGLTSGQWDVSKYLGQEAQIIVRDLNPQPNRGIRVDAFYYVF